MSDKIYVLDTNIILHNIQVIEQISDQGSNIVVIPETVLVELEEFKKSTSELGYQARNFARTLASCKVLKAEHRKEYHIVKMQSPQGANIHLFAKKHYACDIDTAHVSESNDKRIVEVAAMAQLAYKGQKVIFLSLDIYARMFGLLANVRVETLNEDRSDLPRFAFSKTVALDSSLFRSIRHKPIQNYDTDYAKGTFGYEFVSEDGHRTYAIIGPDETIQMIDEQEDFKGLEIKPVNTRQKYLMKALLDDRYDLTVVDARAGSGKTLMAFVAAMRLIDIGRYEKIIYVRNSIESVERGAEVGFLSGNDEKFRIYNMALYDTLEFIAKKKLKKQSNADLSEALEGKILEMTKRYGIQKLWPGEARGRTLTDAIVILDEWQNSSNNTTQLILSRLDSSCKAIVIGSNRQIDNVYLNRYNNGLTTLLKESVKYHTELSIFAMDLERSVRGKFAQFADDVFE
jgi:PhoH-like ATPase